MDKSHLLNIPMVVRSLDIHKDPFQPRENDDELLGDETPYLSAIETLMYLANNTRPNIYFAISLLARFSSAPTKRHWNGVKHVLRLVMHMLDIFLIHIKLDLRQTIYLHIEAQLYLDVQ